jgi:plastocyanin
MNWRGMLILLAIALVGSSCGGEPRRSSEKPASGAGTATQGVQAAEMECAPASTEIQLVALESEAGEPPSFNKDCIAVPAGEPFTVSLRNKDFLEHNFSLFTDEELSELLFRGDRFRGPGETLVYDVPAVAEPGQYAFVCDVHLTLMRGTLLAQ